MNKENEIETLKDKNYFVFENLRYMISERNQQYYLVWDLTKIYGFHVYVKRHQIKKVRTLNWKR